MMDSIPVDIIRLGRIFGSDRIAFSFLFRRLTNAGVTADTVQQMIANNTSLFQDTNVDWKKWRRLLDDADLTRHLTAERLEKEFRERMPELYFAVKNDPAGPAWFANQLSDLRIKLGIELPPTTFHPIDKQ